MRTFLSLTAALACLSASFQASAGVWTIQTVDSPQVGYQTGVANSLRLDSQGNPSIAYWVGSNGTDKRQNSSLKYAKRIGQTWQVQTVDSQGSVGGFASLAFDSLDRPRISYDDFSNQGLKYAAWNGSVWQTQTVLAVDCRETSLALDALGNPEIAYYDYGNYNIRNLEYVSWNGSSWSRQTVDPTTGVGFYTSMALDSSGRPSIGYYDNSSGTINGGVRYASWNGTSWTTQVVESNWISGPSLALDAAGNPHFSYYGRNSQGTFYLKHAYWTGNQWAIQLLEPAYNGYYYGATTSIVIGADGKVRIAYEGGTDTSKQFVKYGYLDGSGWHSETLESFGGWAYNTGRSMAVDAAGSVHMSYYVNGTLRYAYLVPEPSSVVALLCGVAALPLLRRKRA